MWEDHGAHFARPHAISLSEANLLRFTAENLTASQESGRGSTNNIVAACFCCNRTRHRKSQPKSPADYALKVRERLNKGKWHGITLVSF